MLQIKCKITVSLMTALVFSLSVFVPAVLAQVVPVDFDQAMTGLHFSLEGDDNGENGGNGIPDATEMALVARVLNNPDFDLSKRGGAYHQITKKAYEQALQFARKDLTALLRQWPTSAEVAVGYSLLGEVSFQKIAQMVAGFGANMQSDYAQSTALAKFFGAQGDADGDGVSNLQEYLAHKAMGRDVYLDAALDPEVTLSGDTHALAGEQKKLKVGIVLYPGFEVLDVYGPLQMWAYVQEFEVMLIAEQAGPVASAQKVESVATHSFADIEHLDVLLMPGGMGTFEQLENPKLMEFIRRVDANTRYTASVCTGSALLAKAGVLDGQKATANKRFFFLSQQQSDKTDWVQDARWVESGKYFTSSGISAGTDMALGLLAHFAGKEKAAEMASLLEYQWHSDASYDPFAEFVKPLAEQENSAPVFTDSWPEENEVLAEAPRYLNVYFNKAPNVAKSQITVTDASGKEQQVYGLHTMGHNDLMIMVNDTLPAGEYQIQWRASFDGDTHQSEDVIGGTISFVVAPVKSQ